MKKQWFEKLADWIESRHGRRNIYRCGANGEPELYLVRYYLFKSKWCELMIHRFYMSDAEAAHDHPWRSFGWILKNGYIEHLGPNNEDKAKREVGQFSTRNAYAFHRVELVKGTAGDVWTLFGTFKRFRDWGFNVDGVYTNWLVHMKNTGSLDTQSEHFEFTNGILPKRLDNV